MGLLSEGGGSLERKRREDLKRAVLEELDGAEGVGRGGSVRYADLMRRVGEGASVEVEGIEFGEALRALEQEGKVMVMGEGARRMVRRVTGVI